MFNEKSLKKLVEFYAADVVDFYTIKLEVILLNLYLDGGNLQEKKCYWNLKLTKSPFISKLYIFKLSC